MEKTLIIDSPVLKKGFTSAPNAVLYDSSLSIGARWLYIILLSFAWQENECWPGHERLAQIAGCHRNTIEKYLKELRTAGLVSWKRRGLNQTNIYYLHDPSQALKIKDAHVGVHPDAQGLVHQDAQQLGHKEYSDEEYVVVVKAASGQNPAGEGGQQEIAKCVSTGTGVAGGSGTGGPEVFPVNAEGTEKKPEIPVGCQARPESPVVLEADAKVKIQDLFIKTVGYPLPEAVLNELVGYPPGYVEQKIKMLESGKEKANTVGWLLEACREDYRYLPGPKPVRKGKGKLPRPPGTGKEHDKYRELYRLV
ncbi:helix-turn-helix domain-containing protein [Neomoorella humiferrea]|uniref:Helix-turn-helix domain-containing protein n=1 Tax=Neomoorella humiferrea TaxID=676965 RepID=A0A2T0AR03_9FIRM|nr:helix-turn-helix domain-containing protein [Moorella humiferrea]PRR71916.1 hypothetical protein MOHU_15480 [Moorella humiferrea]